MEKTGCSPPGSICQGSELLAPVARPTRGATRSCPQSRRQPMSVPTAWPQVLDFFGTPIVIESSPGQLSSDAGLLPIRQFDERIGFTRAFAAALDDPRDP